MAERVPEVVTLTRPTWAAADRPIDVVLDLASDAVVPMRRPVLQDTLRNLVMNAIEALGTTGGQVAVSTALDPAATGQVAITVADDGPGIPADAVPQLFEPFYTTTGQSRRGLGLVIAKQWVEDAGGSLELVSVAPHDTRFRILLPAASPDPGVASPNAPPPDFGGARILLVDDDHHVREVVQRLLTLSGGTVTTLGTPLRLWSWCAGSPGTWRWSIWPCQACRGPSGRRRPVAPPPRRAGSSPSDAVKSNRPSIWCSTSR